MRKDPRSEGVQEEDTITYDEIDFYLDARRLVLAGQNTERRGRSRPLLFMDLDHYFEDHDSMMA